MIINMKLLSSEWFTYVRFKRAIVPSIVQMEKALRWRGEEDRVRISCLLVRGTSNSAMQLKRLFEEKRRCMS